MTRFCFDKSNHFYNPLILFTGAVLGMQGLWAYRRALHEIDRAVTWSNLPVPRRPLVLAKVVIPDNHESLGKVVHCTLTNGKAIVEALQQGSEIEAIEYEDKLLVTGKLETSDSILRLDLPPTYLTLAAQVAINSGYEGVSGRIIAKWGKNARSWPQILQYFRHVRNASSHGGRFDIRARGAPAIDSHNPPRWLHSVMPDDAAMNGKTLFGDWWELGDVPIFLGDVNFHLRMEGIRP